MPNTALFWDFDGTLIHGEDTFFNALSRALQDHGACAPEAMVWETLRRSCTWYAPEISYAQATGAKWWTRLFAGFAGLYGRLGLPEDSWGVLNAQFKAEILDTGTYTLYEDAVPVLRRCKALGFKSYLLTNNFPELAAVADGLGLRGLYEDAIVSSNLGYEKPRPEIFAAARSAARGAQRCVMIGDNPVADIGGGKAAGMAAILVHRQAECAADFICDELYAVLDILQAQWRP